MISKSTHAFSFPSCPEQLTPEQIDQYHRDGYLAFHDVISPEEVEAVKAEMSRVVSELREGHTVFGSSYGEMWKPTGARVSVQFEPGHVPTGGDDPELELKIRKYVNLVWHSDLLHHIALTHPRVQGVLSCLLGSDPIICQNVALVKPAFYGTEKPWHQDDAYFNVAPLEAVCGVWIAIDEAGADNGCMHVLPGAHTLGPLLHHHHQDCEIAPDRLDSGLGDLRNAVPVPLPPGGAMFFSGILPHQTPPNQTAQRRRALQLHYRSQDSRLVSPDEYDQIFAEADGTPASCSAIARRGV